VNTELSRYEELRASFRWELPTVVNIGVEVADRHPRDAPAILVTDGRTITRTVTYGELSDDSNRLANALEALGVSAGDRVGIVLSQRVETALAHVAAYKLGAIALPLSVQFGPDALGARLGDADARVVIGEAEALERVRELGVDACLVDVDRDLSELVRAASPSYRAATTGPDTPALLVYTSGTTGPPKGALHGHRVLAGHLPGFELSHDAFPRPGDRIWTPADWAWIGGLYDVLMPALAHGVPVVAYRARRFDPEQTIDLLERAGVRNVFMPATALRLLRAADGTGAPSLRTVASGGETVGEETGAWVEERFGVRLNEFYGQTEANLLIGNCSAWPAKPGSMGLPYPGHDIALREGEVAARVEGDPVAFLGYWRNPEATEAKMRDGWLLTGDLAQRDGDGYLWFVGRADDLISSGGHRIGPGEIEDCLVRHPAVAIAAAIGVSDDVRGEVVKAFVVPVADAVGDDALAEELRGWVRQRLAPYEVPRLVEFVEELPLTVTGKIRRGELRRLEAERERGGPPSS
jgi:acetyl-CoA synthetase